MQLLLAVLSIVALTFVVAIRLGVDNFEEVEDEIMMAFLFVLVGLIVGLMIQSTGMK